MFHRSSALWPFFADLLQIGHEGEVLSGQRYCKFQIIHDDGATNATSWTSASSGFSSPSISMLLQEEMANEKYKAIRRNNGT